jgi:hypothetical protein
MQLEQIKEGDKLSFLWHPGYRGQLRDGETVIVVAHVDEYVEVKFRQNQSEKVKAQHLSK